MEFASPPHKLHLLSCKFVLQRSHFQCYRWYAVIYLPDADDSVGELLFMVLKKKLAMLKVFDEAFLGSLFIDP